MRYGTVCSGVEAFGPAWEAMGYECAFHAEIATHPSAVLRYHYPTVPNYGDFSQIQPSPATRIDVLCGGTPCQDFSVAGLRKGLAGDRGNLTLEFARLAERLRPRWLVWENVPGVLSADGGRAFGQFLTLLAECGYYAAYRVLDAQHFGVPQRRRRVFLVAHLGDWRPAAAVLFERHGLQGHSAPSKEQGEGAPPAPSHSARTREWPARVAATLDANFGRLQGGNDQHAFQGATHFVPAAPIAFDTTQVTSKANRSRCEPGAPCHTLSRGGHAPAIAYQCHGGSVGEMGVLRAGNGSMTGGIPFVAAFKAGQGEKAGGIGYSESLAPTLGAAQSGTQLSPAIVFGWNKSASQTMRVDADATDAVQAASSSQPAALIGSAVRRLTPLECERLMGYPDNWTQYGVKPNDTQYTVADGPRYQMCGNGWATPVANWVAERLMMVEKLLPPTPPTIKETTPENLNS